MEGFYMNKKISLVIWLTAIILVITAGSIIYNKNKSRNGNGGTDINQDITAGISNQKVPDFSLKDLNGNTVNLSDYKGKNVILNFFTTWCTYCRQEMPEFDELNKSLEKENKAVILAVDVQEDESTVKNYVSENKLTLKFLLDT